MTMHNKNHQNAWAVFLIFLKLGLTSFGGPVAHLGYFRDEFVTRRQWLSDQSYNDLVALCQFLPGPASSQVGIALGLLRSGYAGAVAAWLGFTLPSAMVLILFALGLAYYSHVVPLGILHGFKVVAVAVVAQAVSGMARTLCSDVVRISLMLATSCFVLFVPSVWGQVVSILIAGLIGCMLFKPQESLRHDPLPILIQSREGFYGLGLFFVLLLGLPLLAALSQNQALSMVDAFYRTGALVFGGGHVVLPLLQAEVVPNGWVNKETFLAGYGVTQAVPGPLFTFAAFLGASMNHAPTGWLGGLMCLLAIFAPSFLLVIGVLPFWEKLRHNPYMQTAFSGVNAAVVGLLLAALYQPVWTSAIYTPQDLGLAFVALVALMFWKLPPWVVVIGGGVAGWLLSMMF